MMWQRVSGLIAGVKKNPAADATGAPSYRATQATEWNPAPSSSDSDGPDRRSSTRRHTDGSQHLTTPCNQRIAPPEDLSPAWMHLHKYWNPAHSRALPCRSRHHTPAPGIGATSVFEMRGRESRDAIRGTYANVVAYQKTGVCRPFVWCSGWGSNPGPWA